MADLGAEVRRYLDEAAPPIRVGEVLDRAAQREARSRRRRVVARVGMVSLFALVAGTIAVLAPSRHPGSSYVGVGQVRSLGGCGVYDARLGSEPVDGGAQVSCLDAALQEGATAWLTVLRSTLEGDDIVTTLVVVGPRRLAVVTDATEDRYGGRQFSIDLCPGVRSDGDGSPSGSGCGRVQDCGSYDMGSQETWDRALEEPALGGVRCLTEAFDDRGQAAMGFSYSSGDVIYDFAYLVDEPGEVIVATRRHRPDLDRSWGFTIERCRRLFAGLDGQPVTPPDDCSPLQVPAGSPPAPNLELPPEGDAASGSLDGGEPVWTVRHRDGSVSVVGAVSTHRPYGVGQLVGWCRGSSVFEDPQHGNQYDERGSYRAGPAPIGLPAFAAEPSGDDAIVVHATSLPVALVSSTGGLAGCLTDGTGESPTGYSPGTLRLHDLASEPGVALEEALSRSGGEVVVISGAEVVVSRGRSTVVCEGSTNDEPPRCDGPEAVGFRLPDGASRAVITGTFAARVVDGVVYPIAYVAGMAVRP